MSIVAWDGRYLVASMFASMYGNYSAGKCQKCDSDILDAYRHTSKMCLLEKDVRYDNGKKIIAVAWDGPIEYATSFIDQLICGNTLSELKTIFKHGKYLLRSNVSKLMLVFVLEDRSSVLIFTSRKDGIQAHVHDKPPCVMGLEFSTFSAIKKVSGATFESAGACVKATMLAHHPNNRQLMYYDFDNLTESPVIKVIPKLEKDVEKRWNFVFEPLEDLESP